MQFCSSCIWFDWKKCTKVVSWYSELPNSTASEKYRELFKKNFFPSNQIVLFEHIYEKTEYNTYIYSICLNWLTSPHCCYYCCFWHFMGSPFFHVPVPWWSTELATTGLNCMAYLAIPFNKKTAKLTGIGKLLYQINISLCKIFLNGRFMFSFLSW